jgi:hypothetical protein
LEAQLAQVPPPLLLARVNEIHGRNDELLRTVDAQRGEIEGINKVIRNALEDIEGAVGSASSIPLNDMRDSMDEIIPTLRV